MKIEQIKERILGLNPDKSDRLTMLEPPILDNVEYCITECEKNDIKGDFVETGVWKGGAVILGYNLYKKSKTLFNISKHGMQHLITKDLI
jgi:hypothetical protein